MDRSIPSLTNPAVAPRGERRRSIRQKLHTPVYASFNGPQTGMVVDLSELLDLHEEGFAVQTSQGLEVNRAITVCLDLPETKNYIHSTGQVIWSDDSGRRGIRFSGLSEKSRRVLKEWLFANLMIGCSNHAARIAQLAGRLDESSEPATVSKAPSLVPISSGSAIISAVEAVRLVVRDIDDDLDAILQLVTERALSFTGASGSALAFLTGGKMSCRARAGATAPPLGAPVDVKHGLTGECVRRGVLVSCEDTANDPRVDPEVCRALGIGSFMATPIVSDLRVIGLLEICSPRPRTFTDTHATILERLVELIPRSGSERAQPKEAPPGTPIWPEAFSGPSQPLSSAAAPVRIASIRTAQEVVEEPEPEVLGENAQQATERGTTEEVSNQSESAPQTPARLLYRALLGLAIVVVFLVLGYVLAPVIEKRWAVAPQASPQSSSAAGSAAPGRNPVDPGPQVSFLTDLRNLAEQGNAEAQWQLGARYHNGEGVPRDDVQAIEWFQRAAEQGNVPAQATLGAYYWAGRGVPQDLTKAYFWSALALAQGDENSKSRLEGLATQMTPQQIASARQQAEVWIQNHSERAKSVAN